MLLSIVACQKGLEEKSEEKYVDQDDIYKYYIMMLGYKEKLVSPSIESMIRKNINFIVKKHVKSGDPKKVRYDNIALVCNKILNDFNTGMLIIKIVVMLMTIGSAVPSPE